jgi:hypothetical protein
MENIKIERHVDGDETTFAVEGPVNTNTSPSLQDILIVEFDTAAKGITIDLIESKLHIERRTQGVADRAEKIQIDRDSIPPNGSDRPNQGVVQHGWFYGIL